MSKIPSSTQTRLPGSRPRRWVLLLLALLVFAQINGVIRVMQWPDAPGMWSPAIQVSAHVIWGIVAFWGLLRLLRRRLRALENGLLILLSFVVYIALRITLFAQADYDRERLPFLLVGMGVVSIGIIVVIVQTRRDAASKPQAGDEK